MTEIYDPQVRLDAVPRPTSLAGCGGLVDATEFLERGTVLESSGEQREVLRAIEPRVARLIEEHRARRQHWYFHDLIPWEEGRDFGAEPWTESQASLDPVSRTALLVNLLTEDNLPWYHLALNRHLPTDSPWNVWSRIWTAEEGQHAISLRTYMLVTRNCDPVELENDRMATVMGGWVPDWQHPAELFAYTSAQELATRISHRNTGKLTSDQTAFDLMRNIAADENHHFLFYKEVMAEFLKVDPEAALRGIYRAFENFQMPGTAVPGFRRRSLAMAKAGVYNPRIHLERVLKPLIQQWGIAELPGLSGESARMQQSVVALVSEEERRAERFDALISSRSTGSAQPRGMTLPSAH